ncbi:MAG: PEGA domain-containing protein [Ignavibacteriales bacterium]|nr:PEGA domain-containing protein [Ignavibacteriales bacterium]
MKTGLTILLVSLAFEAVESQTTHISFFSDPPGAEVFIDSTFAGRTPLLQVEVPHGLRRIRLFLPSASDWNAVARNETLQVVAGEEIQKTYELGSTLAVNSIPPGASVLLGGVELGTTPLYYRSSKSVKGELIVRKQGFEPKSIDASAPPGFVTLNPLNGGILSGTEIEYEESPDSDLRRWATYSSGAAMVISGVIAAYYKERANSRFDQYLSTNRPDDLASTNRNDRRSAIALVVTQISLATLTYLLLSE